MYTDDDFFFDKSFHYSLNGIVRDAAVFFHDPLYESCSMGLTVEYDVGYPEFIFIVGEFIECSEGEV